MKSLAQALRGALGHPVVDDTGLTGGFDFTLTWTPDTADTSRFSALQDQLGLKIESEMAPVDTIVIDPVQKPSPN